MNMTPSVGRSKEVFNVILPCGQEINAPWSRHHKGKVSLTVWLQLAPQYYRQLKKCLCTSI